ncbi:MAG: histidine kinase, partial [Burkholderiales bacterium]|nr:histidine kinase [Phycisphaerae bacterium]
MSTLTQTIPSILPTVAADAERHLREHQISIWARTDRLFAGLLLFEFIAGIALALWRSPLTWTGASSSIHPHVWAAAVLGAVIVALPVYLAARRPAQQLTRHVVAISQMLMSGLLIHLGDGRIEMHFHIFGSLAFLAFYRDWRVLITASAVVAVDHLVRGLFAPQTIYGVISASSWRTLEHAGWVIFEDIFLIGSCLQGVREMRGIAQNRALLEHNHRTIETKVQERTAQLKSAQDQLMTAARSAGMAEIATSVLHNVGNVLNSVNVSATIVADKLRHSEMPSLGKVSEMIAENKPQLGAFFTLDERGKMLPDFIVDLAKCLGEEQQLMLAEV